MNRVLSLPDLTEIFSSDKIISYCDGVFAIENNYADSYQSWLTRVDGSWSAGPFTILIPRTNGSEDQRTEAFTALEGETITVFSPDGEILLEKTIPGLSSYDYADGRLFCCIERDTYYTYLLMDMEGNTLYDTGENCFYCVELLDENGARLPHRLWSIASDRLYPICYDLIDEDGQIVASGLRSIGTQTDEAVAVIKGSSVGLMDLYGCWITKNSIYSIDLLD